MSKSRDQAATATKIKKKYNEKLQGHIEFFDKDNFEASLDNFIVYLQYLRDMAILEADKPELSIKANSLHAAIREYEQYQFAKQQYDALKEDNENTTKAEAEISEHLTCFCKLLISGAKMWFSK